MRFPSSFLSLSLLLLLPYASLTTAAIVTGSIKPNTLLPSISSLPPSTLITLTTSSPASNSRSSLILADGTFKFRDVPAGQYLLEVHCRTHVFPPLRVDVKQEGYVEVYGTWRGNEWDNKGERRAHPIDLWPLKANEFYVRREGFNPLKMLGNPMILFALVAIGGMALMPKMVENMDPETRAEFEKSQKNSPFANPGANPLQNFDMASFLAGKTADPAAGGSSSGGNNGKKK